MPRERLPLDLESWVVRGCRSRARQGGYTRMQACSAVATARVGFRSSGVTDTGIAGGCRCWARALGSSIALDR